MLGQMNMENKVSTLQAINLEKTFKGRKVVNKVNISIDGGKVIGLLGPNGAGKTTSFYMVAGLLTPDNGDVLLENETISQLPIFERARRGISYLPQESSIFKKLTVTDNIKVALEAQLVEGDKKRKRLEKLLGDFSIEHIKNEYGFSLSGGERRRVEIARALANKPKFVLLDEPFAGIDPIAVNDIRQIVTSLKDKGIGILITDHNVRETLSICDYAYILKEGKIEVEGSPEEIIKSDVAKKFYLGNNFKL
jgi:lipopolysaccharide export system ATP-binding protein